MEVRHEEQPPEERRHREEESENPRERAAWWADREHQRRCRGEHDGEQDQHSGKDEGFHDNDGPATDGGVTYSLVAVSRKARLPYGCPRSPAGAWGHTTAVTMAYPSTRRVTSPDVSTSLTFSAYRRSGPPSRRS